MKRNSILTAIAALLCLPILASCAGNGEPTPDTTLPGHHGSYHIEGYTPAISADGSTNPVVITPTQPQGVTEPTQQSGGNQTAGNTTPTQQANPTTPNGSGENANPTSPTTPANPTNPTDPEDFSNMGAAPELPHLSDPDLYLDSLGGYSGNFLEDGTGGLISNVAALLVTNTSDKMLQAAEITFQVTGSETARFFITNLPAGATVLAMETSRRPYSSEDSYLYGQTASAYLEANTLESDRFSFDRSESGNLTIFNKTNDTFNKVYVYYKYKQTGSIYLGGITFRVPFENIPAHGSVESYAGHFNSSNSEIVSVVVMNE